MLDISDDLVEVLKAYPEFVFQLVLAVVTAGVVLQQLLHILHLPLQGLDLTVDEVAYTTVPVDKHQHHTSLKAALISLWMR